MPWAPEMFSAPVLQRLQDKRRRTLATVPYYDGLLAGELDALVESFAGEPELHHPLRGRVRGARALREFAAQASGWLHARNVSVHDVDHLVAARQGFEEVVLALDGDGGRVEVAVAIVADRHADGRIDELRVYFSDWPLTRHHSGRPPVLQPDPKLRLGDVVGDYHRALAAGDIEAIVAAFAPDGYAREPAGVPYVHAGRDGLRDFYARMLAGGGIPLEHCALIDDGRACALEYNVVRWGTTELAPQAGLAVHIRSGSGRLAAVRIYDDADPPPPP